MQAALSMRAFRSLHLRKTLYSLSFLNPNPNFNSPNNSRLLSKSHSTTPNESTPSSWSSFSHLPSKKARTVETVFDPLTGSFVTKREGKIESTPAVDKPEFTSPTIVDQGSSRVYGDVIGSSNVNTSSISHRKKGKSKSVYVCESCGHSDGQWWGTCKQCEKVGTMKRFTTEVGPSRKVSGIEVSGPWLPKESTAVTPIKLSHVHGRINHMNWRIPLLGEFGAEVERVLGGGLVPGSLVLVGGDPGVGKSTLMLQIAGLIAEGNDADVPARVIYVSGEESVEQICNRADRLSIETEELFLYSSTDIEDILEQAQHLSPKAIVIDSIQTVYLREVTGSAGGDVQVRECTSALLRFAKKTKIPIFVIGHVTKTGDIAGPRVLEHIVDVVLYMEGEKHSSHRLLRSVKNRFGSTDELGVLKMSHSGLEGVSNPSEMFLGEQHSDSDFLAGVAVAVIMDGSRAFLIEIQALCVGSVASSSAGRHANGSSFVKHVNGIQGSRADMIISVIIKQAGLKLQENGIYLNVVSGVNLTETAGDLAIAAAICSSFLEFPIPNGIAFIAEVGLGGELRVVPQLEKRVSTLSKLGYKKCIIPKSGERFFANLQPQGMEILGCKNLKEMINTVFRDS